MQINSLNNSMLQGIEKIGSVNNETEKQNFSDIFNQALSDAKDTDSTITQTNVDLLTGENDSIHQAMIDAEKAKLALNLAIQVRNKVIDAYNEVMRMQV